MSAKSEHSPDGPIAGIFELYLSDPAVQPDMAQWDTEILMLLND